MSQHLLRLHTLSAMPQPLASYGYFAPYGWTLEVGVEELGSHAVMIAIEGWVLIGDKQPIVLVVDKTIGSLEGEQAAVDKLTSMRYYSAPTCSGHVHDRPLHVAFHRDGDA